MEKKKMSYYFGKMCGECVSAFLYPFLILALSFIRHCQCDPVNIFFFIFLFALSVLFAIFTREGTRLEKKKKKKVVS